MILSSTRSSALRSRQGLMSKTWFTTGKCGILTPGIVIGQWCRENGLPDWSHRDCSLGLTVLSCFANVCVPRCRPNPYGERW